MNTHEELIKKFNELKHTINTEDWEELVSTKESDIYEGIEVDEAIEIMKILDEFYDKLSAKLDEQDHSGGSAIALYGLVNHFHHCGCALKDII